MLEGIIYFHIVDIFALLSKCCNVEGGYNDIMPISSYSVNWFRSWNGGGGGEQLDIMVTLQAYIAFLRKEVMLYFPAVLVIIIYANCKIAWIVLMSPVSVSFVFDV
jgi:hypothetical protein